jgi:Raf kinase inhibitor-like YbhB/YbcL family protein
MIRSIVSAAIVIFGVLDTHEETSMPMTLSSSTFSSGSAIPKKYTGDGPDLSPELKWEGAPKGTKSFALIMDDPDAPRGTWVHWVLYDLPATTKELKEGFPKDEQLTTGVKQGMTDFGTTGYGGPYPPPGKPHRYYFKLYALDTELKLPPKATKKEVEAAMKGHILAHAELMGTYERK